MAHAAGVSKTYTTSPMIAWLRLCTKVCPKGCFHLEGQKSVWNPAGCIACVACIHACPTLAIQLNGPEKNPRARYRNENISICEIVAANQQGAKQQGE